MFASVRRSFVQTVKQARKLHTLKFQPLTPDRYDEALEHLRTCTYHDVPIYKASGLLSTGKAPIELDKVYYNSMKEGVSLIALKDGKLAGVLVNGILTPDAVPGAIEDMKKSTDEKYKKMDYMFLMLLLEMDIFNRFGINKALECRMLSTTREYRGSGLGKVLVEKLTQVARDFDFPLIVGEAVNDYLWRLLSAEGWTMIREMPYDDYIDEATGKPVYKVDPPHHILGVCGRIVDNRCASKDPLPLPSPKIYYPINMDLAEEGLTRQQSVNK